MWAEMEPGAPLQRVRLQRNVGALVRLWSRHLGGDPLAIQVIRWLQHQRGVEKAPSIGLIQRGAAWCGALRGGALLLCSLPPMDEERGSPPQPLVHTDPVIKCGSAFR